MTEALCLNAEVKRVGVSLSHGEVKSRRVNATGVKRRRLHVYLSDGASVGRRRPERRSFLQQSRACDDANSLTHSLTHSPFTPARTLPPPNSCSGSPRLIICFFLQVGLVNENSPYDGRCKRRLERMAISAALPLEVARPASLFLS